MIAKLKIASPKRRRVIIIAAVTLVAVLIGAYAFWSVNTWGAYKTSYADWQKELRTSVDAAIALPVTTSSERTKKLSAFKNISTEIDSAKQSLCRLPTMIGWQRVIGTLHEREEACNQVVGRAGAFGEKMKATVGYLESEQALASAIAAMVAASNDKLTEATWGSQVSIWQDGGKVIAKVALPTATFKPIKADAIEKAKAVELAWQELIVAHEAKDKAKYVEAQGKLAAAYDGLAGVATASGQVLSTLATSLQTAYAETFNSHT